MAPGSPRSPSGRDRLLDLEPLVPREHGERRATTHEAGTVFDLRPGDPAVKTNGGADTCAWDDEREIVASPSNRAPTIGDGSRFASAPSSPAGSSTGYADQPA